MKPLLSVLVPAFNAEAFIEKSILSVNENSDFPREIIICDDGSTDATQTAVEAAASLLSNNTEIRLITQSNAGASTARNRAFRASHGRWVLFLDADDRLAAGSLSAMVQMAQADSTAVIHCRWAKIRSTASAPEHGPILTDREVPGWQWVAMAFARDYPTYPGAFLLPRTLVDRAGLWNEQLSFQDDMEFFSRTLCQAPSVRFCADALFLYRADAPGSLSKSSGRTSSASHLLATELAVDQLLQTNRTPQSLSASARQLMLVSYEQYLHAPELSHRAELKAKALVPSNWPLPPLPGGLLRRFLQACLGWKLALRVHQWCRARV